MASEFVIAVAGSGKTERLIDRIACQPEKRFLITTFTNSNLFEIESRLSSRGSDVAGRVTAATWFSFLLRDGVLPYQSELFPIASIRSLNYVARVGDRRFRRIPEADAERFYRDNNGDVYSARAGKLACKLNELTGGKVVERIRRLYDCVLVDEVQDVAGTDLDFLELLIRKQVEVIGVGDPRQSILKTSATNRNKKYLGAKIVEWMDALEGEGLIETIDLVDCYRCAQPICDAANSLYPDLPAAVSKSNNQSEHVGVFVVRRSNVVEYAKAFGPAVLRPQKNTDTCGLHATNFGVCKGRTASHVLIFAQSTFVAKFLLTDDVDGIADQTRSQLYVAITRAQNSAAFVVEDDAVVHDRWQEWAP